MMQMSTRPVQGVVTVEMKPGCGLMELYGQPGAVLSDLFGWLKHILSVFPKIGVPQNGWFIMENPIKMDDLGVPLFLETPI